jgi:hypothetical protein
LDMRSGRTFLLSSARKHWACDQGEHSCWARRRCQARLEGVYTTAVEDSNECGHGEYSSGGDLQSQKWNTQITIQYIKILFHTCTIEDSLANHSE